MSLRKTLFGCLLYFLVAPIWAQQESSCRSLFSDTAVINCYLKESSWLFEVGLTDSAWQVLHNLSSLSSGFPNLEGKRLYQMSLVYLNLSKYDSSHLTALAAAAYFEKLEQFNELNEAYNQAGNALRESGKLKEATEYYFKAIDLAKTHGMDSINAIAYMNLAPIFIYLDDREKELEYIQKAYQNAKQYHNQRMIGISSMGLVQKYRRALQFDSAYFYANQALESSEALHNAQMIGYSYLNLAMISEDQGNLEQTDQYYAKILDNEKIPVFDRARFHYFYGDVQREREQLWKARTYYERGYEMVKPLNGLNLQHTLAAELYPLYGKLEDYPNGYAMALEYIELTDSIYQIEKEERIQELSTKYETAEKEKELQAKEIELIEKTNQRNSLIGLTIGLLIISGLVFFGFLRRIQLTQRLRKQETEIAAQQVRQMQQEQSYLAIQSMVAGEEAERSRLARELHDGLGGMLSNLKLTLSKQLKSREKSKDFDPIVIVDKASLELRRIAQNLMPESLARFGLIQSLEDLISDFEHSTHLHIDFQHYNIQEPLPDSLTLPTYRIIQELIHNVVKHARASEVLVQLIQREKILHLTVEDDGIGLAWEKAIDKGGYGLKNIQTRLAVLKGDLQVDSQKGKGTTITIEIGIPS